MYSCTVNPQNRQLYNIGHLKYLEYTQLKLFSLLQINSMSIGTDLIKIAVYREHVITVYLLLVKSN